MAGCMICGCMQSELSKCIALPDSVVILLEVGGTSMNVLPTSWTDLECDGLVCAAAKGN